MQGHARSHPTRIKILALIAQDESRSLDPDDLRQELARNTPSSAEVLYHLSVLERAQLLPSRTAT